MTDRLSTFMARELAMPARPEIAALAEVLARRLNGIAVLFYGSVLRTGDLDGLLDFYVLTERSGGSLLRRVGMRWLWPEVSYHEIAVGNRLLRAKVATMPIATFERAVSGRLLDTTVWTRFVQPASLVWQADASVAQRVARALANAAMTAARFAVVLGPARGRAAEFWGALFSETYRAEMRVEPPGRDQQILSHDPARYAALLPLALEAAGVEFAQDGEEIAPRIAFEKSRAIIERWLVRVKTGKGLNIARLIKASFTFDGAARYGLWKVQRHTGVEVALTPWRERHPVLAAPGVLWQVMRSQAR